MRINCMTYRVTILIVLWFCFQSLNANGQSSYLKNRWNIKTSYSKSFNWQYGDIESLYFIKHYNPLFDIELNHAFYDHIEMGIYVGYSPLLVTETSGRRSSRSNNLISYGINANYHFLPHFIVANDFRVDAYGSVKLGAYTRSDMHFQPITRINYGVYGGLAFYPGKHFGLHVEYGYGNNTKLKYGACWKF